MPKAHLITFEGTDGAGKTTQAKILADRLTQHGYAVRSVREPGSTPAGDLIRNILKNEVPIGATTELLLFEAARAQLVAEEILPYAETLDYILCDRYIDSTVAYQGYGRNLALDQIEYINNLTIHGFQPQLTLLLEIPYRQGLNRVQDTARRFENLPESFQLAVQKGYSDQKEKYPDRIKPIDATRSPNEVAQEIWTTITQAGLINPKDKSK